MAKVIAPRDKTRYLHPMLCSLVQVAASAHEKLGMKAQANRLTHVSQCSLEMVWNNAPGNQITHGPEHCQRAQNAARLEGQKLEEDCGIYGHVAAHSQSQTCVQSTRSAPKLATRHWTHLTGAYVPDPIGATSRSQAEGAAEKQCDVERRSTSDGIGCDTPE